MTDLNQYHYRSDLVQSSKYRLVKNRQPAVHLSHTNEIHTFDINCGLKWTYVE